MLDPFLSPNDVVKCEISFHEKIRLLIPHDMCLKAEISRLMEPRHFYLYHLYFYIYIVLSFIFKFKLSYKTRLHYKGRSHLVVGKEVTWHDSFSLWEAESSQRFKIANKQNIFLAIYNQNSFQTTRRRLTRSASLANCYLTQTHLQLTRMP